MIVINKVYFLQIYMERQTEGPSKIADQPSSPPKIADQPSSLCCSLHLTF